VIHAAFASAFGAQVAERLYRRPHLNSGAFALRADAPHWSAWARALGRALAGAGDRAPSRERLAEQCALNVVVHEDGLRAELLPPWCNWICHHAAPRADPSGGPLREPTPPHVELGIVHETMWSKAPALEERAQDRSLRSRAAASSSPRKSGAAMEIRASARSRRLLPKR
jgi:hypothetical protein